jgi:hypothetical protein
MKSCENKAMLAIRPHFGEEYKRRDILSKGIVTKHVYDRAIVSLNANRKIGKEGHPELLSETEEGLLISFLDNEMKLGRFHKCAAIKQKVYYFFRFIICVFFFLGRRNQKQLSPSRQTESPLLTKLAISLARATSSIQDNAPHVSSSPSLAFLHTISFSSMV